MTTTNNPAQSSAAAVREAAALECEKRGHVTSADAIRALPLPEPDEAKPRLSFVARAIQGEVDAGFGISDLAWGQPKAAIDAFYTLATPARTDDPAQPSERERIVAWLRGADNGLPDLDHDTMSAYRQAVYCLRIADAIERGDHLAGEG